MKILVATHTSRLTGGVENYLREVIPLLISQGHLVRVVVEEGDESQRSWMPDAGAGKGTLVRTPEDATGALAEFRPDVVFNNQLASPDIEECIVGGAPAVLFVHTYYGSCVSGRKMHAFPQPVPCHRLLGPGCLALYYPRRCGGLNPLIALRLYGVQGRRQRLLARYAQVAVASEYMRREVVAAGVKAERAAVLPLFSSVGESERGSFAMDGLKDSDPLRVLFMGRLTDLKGGLLLADAVKGAVAGLGRSISLIVAGDGPLRSEMERRCAQARIDYQFVGWVSGRRRTELLQSVQLLVVPSVWPEPFGIVGIEAASFGVPAVAFDLGGIREWLIPGSTGELASSSPPSASGLAAAIVRAAKDPKTLGALARNAYERSKRFRPDAHLRALSEMLQRVVGAAQ